MLQREVWATPNSYQTEREGWGYTLVMSQSIIEHTPFTHTHTKHIHTKKSLINQFLREGTRGPEGNHSTQKRARIKSTCRESCYSVFLCVGNPTFLEHELNDLSLCLCLLPFSAQTTTPLFLIPFFSSSWVYFSCPLSSSTSSSSLCLPHAEAIAHSAPPPWPDYCLSKSPSF